MIVAARERINKNKSLIDYVDRYELDSLREIHTLVSTGILRFRQSHEAVLKHVALDIYIDVVPGT